MSLFPQLLIEAIYYCERSQDLHPVIELIYQHHLLLVTSHLPLTFSAMGSCMVISVVGQVVWSLARQVEWILMFQESPWSDHQILHPLHLGWILHAVAWPLLPCLLPLCISPVELMGWLYHNPCTYTRPKYGGIVLHWGKQPLSCCFLIHLRVLGTFIYSSPSLRIIGEIAGQSLLLLMRNCLQPC